MKKAMFRYKMSLAGYPDEQIDKVEQWVERSNPLFWTFYRDAILEYARICTDLSMIPTYIRLVNELSHKPRWCYPESAKFVSMIIAGWCK